MEDPDTPAKGDANDGDHLHRALDSLAAGVDASLERKDFAEAFILARQGVDWLYRLHSLYMEQHQELKSAVTTLRAIEPLAKEFLPRLIDNARAIEALGGPEAARRALVINEIAEAMAQWDNALSTARQELSQRLAALAPAATLASVEARQVQVQSIAEAIQAFRERRPRAPAEQVAIELFNDDGERRRIFGDLGERAIRDHLKRALKLPYGTRIPRRSAHG